MKSDACKVSLKVKSLSRYFRHNHVSFQKMLRTRHLASCLIFRGRLWRVFLGLMFEVQYYCPSVLAFPSFLALLSVICGCNSLLSESHICLLCFTFLNLLHRVRYMSVLMCYSFVLVCFGWRPRLPASIMIQFHSLFSTHSESQKYITVLILVVGFLYSFEPRYLIFYFSWFAGSQPLLFQLLL